MQPIEGIHHISLITGDAPRNVDFYARVMGLRIVKKTVNQDDPGVITCSTPTRTDRRGPTSRSSSTRPHVRDGQAPA
jgi:catechol 2,3-dioxygenase-like lactoylglutathione lyase family enzyme